VSSSSLVEHWVDDHVAVSRLNRPEARNALSPELMEELAAAVEAADADPEIRCIVIAGSDEVFASGADIGALRDAASRTRSSIPRPASGDGLPPAARRSSRRSPVGRSAADASSRSCAT
jgi:enoyl-CoA hydratase/carnithine racemase